MVAHPTDWTTIVSMPDAKDRPIRELKELYAASGDVSLTPSELFILGMCSGNLWMQLKAIKRGYGVQK